MKTREERKAESLKALEMIKEGDIFNYSWGYDQTNQEFFKVIKKTPSSVVIRQLKAVITETEGGFMCGNSTPTNEFNTTETLRKIPYLYDGKPYLSFSFGSCDLWNGKPAGCSWYA